MFANFIYVIFAILGLSFLIFIHELGHYWMARRVGMRVEAFAIGFGKPIYTWVRDGVKWHIGWLLFGGYVKIAGTETDDKVDPYTIPDGFFGKKPFDRIKVAFMGPFVNLLFALLVFALLWISGGRDKNFSEFTTKIGWVDTNSELYTLGLRPGDEITEYDDYAFQSYKDHLYAPMIGSGDIKVKGFKVDYESGKKEEFEYTVNPYSHPSYFDKDITTAGIFHSASYLIYDRLPDGEENLLPDGSPLKDSGIQYGDRIVWVDGEFIFSNTQLSELLNDGQVLLTIRRGRETLLRRVPRVLVQELRPNTEFREELIDWQHEVGMPNRRFQNLYMIPYNLTYDCVIENDLRFVDKGDREKSFPEHIYSELDGPLKAGDKIIAVQGKPVSLSYDLLGKIQEKRVNVIVQRDPKAIEEISWKNADDSFSQNIDWSHLAKIAKSIGMRKRVSTLGNLHLLNPIKPKVRSDFPMSDEAKAWLATERLERRKQIEEIEDTEKKAHLLHFLDSRESQLILGLPNPQDRPVTYNPLPTNQFLIVSREIGRTLQALFSGALSPKYITGPVGIVYVMQSTSMVSLKESLFWIGAISLNLGILNLLPIPILDGGTILLSFFEMVTRRRIKPKTLEKVVLLFAILLISFFVFLTYNDIIRVFGHFFGM
ncbi:MAG: Metalloprotease MmpA [Chlamydiae bacterium]|nr:Metalloprotease MmpA [Chlamydiota bacterium]